MHQHLHGKRFTNILLLQVLHILSVLEGAGGHGLEAIGDAVGLFAHLLKRLIVEMHRFLLRIYRVVVDFKGLVITLARMLLNKPVLCVFASYRSVPLRGPGRGKRFRPLIMTTRLVMPAIKRWLLRFAIRLFPTILRLSLFVRRQLKRLSHCWLHPVLFHFLLRSCLL